MNEIKYFLGFWSRYRDEDDEPLYTVECFSQSEFKTEDEVVDWWIKETEENEFARDWDTLDLEFVKEVTKDEMKQYKQNKQYDCRWR